LTVPFPLPLAPPVTVSHALALLVAVQLQLEAAMTLTLPVAATDDVSVDDAGEIVNEQGAPACVTVNVWPAIVSVPVRDAVAVFAATP
jgi:hypothetical protein